MKQILQDLGHGETLLVDVPAAACRSGALRIATRRSLVSLGTERMLLSFGRANWVQKARQQPEKVNMVLAKIKAEGLLPTLDAVRSKLAQPIPLGYCNAGVVLEVGAGVSHWKPGDRVLSNGPHAEVVTVPENLCARIPDGVSDEHAPFAVVGAIALQGIRLLQPTLGECFVVSGLGLVGLLAAQLLKANGARVLGVDFESEKCRLANSFGIETVNLGAGEDLLSAAQQISGSHGVDGVLITAATRSSDPVNQAAQVCRKRGRIVQVGTTGLELARGAFYEKELSLQVSCSYGPGRHDPSYEDKGHDYPLPYVRWTEQRNFEAVLAQLASGSVQVAPLISHRFSFDHALQAYETVASGQALGILLSYETDPAVLMAHESRVVSVTTPAFAATGVPVIGILGAGNFTTRTLLPALDRSQAPARRKLIVSASGVSSAEAARNFRFEQASSDSSRVWSDPDINTVFLTTRHGAHARQTLEGLAAGKHVFVEKPLCLKLEELAALETALGKARTLLMVGFNRRFSPHVQKMKALLDGIKAPRAMTYTVNAGAIPAQQWVQDPDVGGGRIIGEACHFIDLLRFLAGAPIVSARADYLGGEEGKLGDVASLHLRFGDGSIGTVHYLANGDRSYPKERIEVFCGGKVLALDNYRVLGGYGWKGFTRFATLRQEKGHAQELSAFLEAVRDGKPSPIPAQELLEVSRVTIELAMQGPRNQG